jgi:hypothetical protein
LSKRYDARIHVLVEDLERKLDQKLAIPRKQSGLDGKGTEARSIQQGWSFYGILQDGKWTARFFSPADAQEPEAMPSPEVAIVSRGFVNIRKQAPSYSPDTGWNYDLASVIGGVRESERVTVDRVTAVDTPRGKYVWVKLSPTAQPARRNRY